MEGELLEYRSLAEIRAPEGCHNVAVLVEPGRPISRTVDNLTFAFLVTLVHDLEEVVQRDLTTIRYLDGRASMP